MHNRNMKDRVMRVKKTLPGLVLGKRATELPPLYEKSELEAEALKHMSKGALDRSSNKIASTKNLNYDSTHDIV